MAGQRRTLAGQHAAERSSLEFGDCSLALVKCLARRDETVKKRVKVPFGELNG